MMRSAGWGAALGCALVCLAGCGSQDRAPPERTKAPPAAVRKIVLHVPEMTKRLELA